MSERASTWVTAAGSWCVMVCDSHGSGHTQKKGRNSHCPGEIIERTGYRYTHFLSLSLCICLPPSLSNSHCFLGSVALPFCLFASVHPSVRLPCLLSFHPPSPPTCSSEILVLFWSRLDHCCWGADVLSSVSLSLPCLFLSRPLVLSCSG